LVSVNNALLVGRLATATITPVTATDICTNTNNGFTCARFLLPKHTVGGKTQGERANRQDSGEAILRPAANEPSE
jgi:hypothetical protein